MKIKFINALAIAAIATVAITTFSCSENANAGTPEKTDAIETPKTATTRETMEGWSKASLMAVEMMKKQYGEPAERTASMMMWHNTGQWSHTVVYAKEYQHDFPMPHTDVMEQFIDYQVPPSKFTDLAMYDGSVTCNRTNGTMSARCDKEGANFLAINLAHDIIKGTKNVESARISYATSIKEFINGRKPAYMQKLQFDVAKGGTADADKASSIITKEDMMKAREMMSMMEKDMRMDNNAVRKTDNNAVRKTDNNAVRKTENKMDKE